MTTRKPRGQEWCIRMAKVLYLVLHEFPKLSETFILREIVELHEHGHDVRVIALHESKLSMHHEEFNRLPRESVIYLFGKNASISKMKQATHFISWFFRSRGGISLKKITRTILTPRFLGIPSNPARKIYDLMVLSKLINAFILLKRMGFIPNRIHAHFLGTSSKFAYYLEPAFNVPYSLTVHAVDIFTLPGNSISRRMIFQERKHILENAKEIIAISNYNKRFLRQHYDIDPGKIRIVHCGIKPLDFSMKREHEPIHPRERGARTKKESRRSINILSVGRLIEKKGHLLSIEAMKTICNQYPSLDIHFDIVGDGPQRENVLWTIKKHEMEFITELHSNITDQQLNELLANADIFILASKRAPDGDMDGIPVSLMEAMASGVICISTRISGIPELIKDGVTGFLAIPDDVGSLVNKISQAIEAIDEWSTICQAARNHIEQHFNIGKEAIKLVNGFERD
ncbi:glycosyltransferase [Candidatus Bathyarchaeota archaeon]|nr:glycosyltransferase [Candidatus Bathyarchaeota archaeon]